MRAFGIKVSDDEYEAFLHCWNVSGFILGVDEGLMAHPLAEAGDLFARIKARQAGPSAAGARLADRLLTTVEHDILRWRILQPLAPILTRMLIGDPVAAMLGLDVRHPGLVGAIHRVIAATLRTLQILLDPLGQRFQPLAPLAARLGRHVVDYLCLETDDGRPRQVAIPPHWR
jgi:hypothetical protein